MTWIFPMEARRQTGRIAETMRRIEGTDRAKKMYEDGVPDLSVPSKQQSISTRRVKICSVHRKRTAR